MRCLLAAWLLLATALPAGAEIYRWEDERGVSHFSDRIEDVPPAWREDQQEALRRDAPVNLIESLSRPQTADAGGAAAGGAAAPKTGGASARRGADAILPALPAGLGIGVALLIALVAVALGLLLYAWVLRVACRVCGAEPPAFGRALAAVGVQLLAGIGLGIALGIGALTTGLAASHGLAFQLGQAVVSMVLNAAVLVWMEICDGFVQALVVTVVAALITLVLTVAVVFGLAILFGLPSFSG